MDSPDTWRWIWLIAAFVFTVGEMTSPGSFFLFPFAVGAFVAAVLAFAGVGVGYEWIAFVGASGAAFAALRPIARRLDQGGPTAGIGANRIIGEQATVVDDIVAGDVGIIRVGREEWRAEALDLSAIPSGTTVRVIEVRGTRAVVWPDAAEEPEPPALG